MGFDQQFVQFLRHGDLTAATSLLIQKYPHLKKDSDRITEYIRRYQEHYRIRI